MALADKERYNLLFRPDLKPFRDWRSEAIFEEPDIPVGAIFPEETPDDILQDLRDLEEILTGLPTGLEPVHEIVTKLRQRAEILKVEEELEKLPPIPSTPPTTVIPPVPSTPPTVPSEPGPPVTLPGTIYTPIPVTISPGTPTQPPIYREPGTIKSGTVYYPTETIPSSSTVREVPADSYSYVKETIPKTGTIRIPEEEPFVPVGTNVTTPEALVEGLPTSFVPATSISLSIETPRTLIEIAQESYKQDQIDLQKFYLQKMRMALQRYFHHLLGLTAELSLSDPDMLTKNYDGDQVTGISANCAHLHDTIIRSQIQRLQKARLFKKLANADQTVTHMRAWNAAEKERERYYEEAYGNSDNFVDSESNALLRQARSDYDAAYKLALYNMYKYLDASVKLTEDILDHSLTEAKAKAKLIKEGVDIFKTEEVTITSDINSVQQLQPKTKEQADADAAAEQSIGSDTTLTPEEIDKARGIEDPDYDFDLAPSGGHYSKNDINYLCSVDSQLYNRDTPEGRSAIKDTLNLSDKYMAGSEEQEEEASAEAPVNEGGVIEDIVSGSNVSDISSGAIELTTGGIAGGISLTDEEVEANKNKVDQSQKDPSSKPSLTSSSSSSQGNSTVERSAINKQEVITDGNYVVTITYTAYPVTKGSTQDYDARVTAKCVEQSTTRIPFIVSSKNGKPTRTLVDVKQQFGTNETLIRLLDEVYPKLSTKFW